MDDILIENSKLEEGYAYCKDIIESLLESSSLLYGNNKLPTSLSLAILALEETTKLRLLREKISNNESISENEWKKLTRDKNAHKRKIDGDIRKRLEKIEERGQESFERGLELRKKLGIPVYATDWDKVRLLNESTLKMFHGLKNIKENCWYLNWNKDKWDSFLSEYPKKIQDLFTKYILNLAQWTFYEVTLGYKYPEIPLDENSEEFKKFKNDGL